MFDERISKQRRFYYLLAKVTNDYVGKLLGVILEETTLFLFFKLVLNVSKLTLKTALNTKGGML